MQEIDPEVFELCDIDASGTSDLDQLEAILQASLEALKSRKLAPTFKLGNAGWSLLQLCPLHEIFLHGWGDDKKDGAARPMSRVTKPVGQPFRPVDS
jgi:hypothetical protein